METVALPTGVAGTSLEILAPYLPYGIEVQHRDGSPAEKLIGLCYNATELVNVEWHDKPGKNYWYGAKYCKPILKPFSALCTPLSDGTVPAVEIGKEWARNTRNAEIVDEYDGYGESCVISGPGTTLSISRAAFESGRTADWLSKLLRKWHFAVGLEPHQYIAATPATEEGMAGA